jgi:hypothetical protein
MKALAPVFHTPASQPAKLVVWVWSVPWVKSVVVVMGFPLSSRLDCMLMLVTSSEQRTVESDVCQTVPLLSKLTRPFGVARLLLLLIVRAGPSTR